MYEMGETAAGEPCLYTRDPDANELMLIEVPTLTPIVDEEVNNGPSFPWTRLW
jgi:hypothetical protein